MNNAYSIALQSLTSCICDIGIIAGSHHFIDVWARDGCFASFGANICHASDATRRTIETLLYFQRQDGLIPYVVLRGKHNIQKYFGKPILKNIPKPVYRSHLTLGIVPDGGLMTIIAMRAYSEHTQDFAFVGKQYERLVRALDWYYIHFRHNLIREWFACEWADAVLKSGHTLYTNVLYCKAIQDMAWLSSRLEKHKETEKYTSFAQNILYELKSKFWTGTYFADWIDYTRHDYIAIHPNLLAIIFGLTSDKESHAILRNASRMVIGGWSLNNTDKPYPWWRIPLWNHMTGTSDYHNGVIWLQPGLLYVAALHRMGEMSEAKKFFVGIEQKIIEHQGIYEIYEQNGKPVKRFLYQAEQPFAWSSGLFIWVHHLLYG